MGKKNKGVRDLDDRALFRKALADAEPLKKRPKDKADANSANKILGERKNQPESKISRARSRGAMADKVRSKPLPELELGGTANIDRRTADRFRRGRLQIEGRLDLHGLYQDEAHEALTGFIHSSANNGKRCVVVITGKGRADQGGEGQGILRRQVPRWLNEPELRPHILSISQAQNEHGGNGAIYVLLRRRR